ncbi:glutamate formimidoyltransferase [Myxococcota bacterium]|nr:glutamate formimidoyltransferase [Myxococcota bacterium]MBU1429831.1 glutamate formimidoyltransferase [Myxococcota bacterium]MBU1898406.1 glutamate formimidoyltransferase [Myxococcota bacterium]
MRPIVECVPNISEGRDQAIIDACVAAAAAVEGVAVLDVDPGADTHRTVITLAGEPSAVLEGAFELIKASHRLIDMRKHSGAHPRAGATDVCPFVPVAGISMEQCAALARSLGARIGAELDVPVYLYEAAATREDRRNLADVRRGEYEALPQKMADPAWAPDFGPHAFRPKFGAVHVGARPFLAAYNINLNTRSKRLAHDIALSIRQRGRARRDENGEIIRHPNGKPVKIPGLFKHCKAAAWYLDEIEQCQVTMNLTDLSVTAPHQVFAQVCALAAAKGMRVTGSELIGLIPLNTMLEAGRFFLKRQGRSTGVHEAELIRVAVESMGLNDIAPFDPQKKIVEYAIQPRRADRLVDLSLRGFSEALASESPAPGGGSVAALCGALAASLAAMVGNLSHAKKGYEDRQPLMEETANAGQALAAALLRAIDEDTDAFNAVVAANRLPRKTEDQRAAAHAAQQAAAQRAAAVPFEVSRRALACFDLIARMVASGNPNSVTDAGVAAYCAHAAVHGAALNAQVNLPGVEDAAFCARIREGVAALTAQANQRLAQISAQVHTVMEAQAHA